VAPVLHGLDADRRQRFWTRRPRISGISMAKWRVIGPTGRHGRENRPVVVGCELAGSLGVGKCTVTLTFLGLRSRSYFVAAARALRIRNAAFKRAGWADPIQAECGTSHFDQPARAKRPDCERRPGRE